jgi:transcriptional regulator with XRE-family HTH domain
MQTIGERLRELREATGLTLEQLGARFAIGEKEGKTKQAVAAWEKGRNQLTADQIILLCKLFGTSADYLLFGSTLSAKAIQIARKFDALSSEDKKRFEAIFMVVGPAATDERVAESYGTPGEPAIQSFVKEDRRQGERRRAFTEDPDEVIRRMANISHPSSNAPTHKKKQSS